MGIGVSGWRLARAVSREGQLGVVSGALLDVILARRLQDGDRGGHMRRALGRFPFPAIAERVWNRYYLKGGRAGRPYRALPMHSTEPCPELTELCVVANFAEVCLAREGLDHPVGINYLEKIQLPHLPSLYGAMLAGVSYVLMGAGIPSRIPAVLDRFATNQEASYPLHVTGAEPGDEVALRFDPRTFAGSDPPPLERPRFLPIVGSHTLAEWLARRADGRIDGFVLEGAAAGGHNAPPRGGLRVDASGEPIYGERDEVDFGRLRALGLPFWLAGGRATPEKFREALRLGASGIQVGTAFALCDESGLREEYKRRLLEKAKSGALRVRTDAVASPTGLPFKIASLEGSLSDPRVYESRRRVCDVGYLREAYRRPDGALGFRCPAEPVEAYVGKGGRAEAAAGRRCLCNALLSNTGYAQSRKDGAEEPPLITCGSELEGIARFIPPGRATYAAKDVIDTLLQEAEAGVS